MHRGWLCVVLATSLLLPVAVSAAAIPGADLQRSEMLDTRRLGKVSDDERSVLRVEWRAALTGDDEARSVQEMLFSLRRMEATVAEIGRLLRALPAAKPVVAGAGAMTAEPPRTAGNDPRWVLATAASVLLLALWALFRRKPATPAATPQAAARVDNADAGANAAVVPISVPTAVPPAPTVAQPVAAPRRTPAPAAPSPVPNDTAPSTPPAVALAKPEPAPPVEDESPIIEFSLEEADPESVALANARVPQPAAHLPRPPRKAQDPNVDPTMELAEIMLSLGLEQGAAQALVEYTEANPRQALYHWLKLLDIYRNSGNQEEFREAAEKLRRHFNVEAEDWAKAHPSAAPTLENFPRIAAQVQETWSRPEECSAYLRHLLEDNRDGARAGFPRPVAEEILMLIEVLKTEANPGQGAET